jgi:prophage regulatory protein
MNAPQPQSPPTILEISHAAGDRKSDAKTGIFRAPLGRSRICNQGMNSKAQTSRLIDVKDAMEMLGVSRATVYRLMDEDGFPRQIAIRGCARWLESDVRSWIDAQAKASAPSASGRIRVLEFHAAQVCAIDRLAQPGERTEDVILRLVRAAASGQGIAPTTPSSRGVR